MDTGESEPLAELSVAALILSFSISYYLLQKPGNSKSKPTQQN
jgi:hypothetical protein